MFGKKRRAASNPPQRVPATPSASASLAATKAFARDRETTHGLSNAAAAQALRTHVITPTPVGDTVTKRMIRRNSTSSNGSSARLPPGTLRRQSSSGSMTERSFRAPSPGRGSPAEPSAPPVPPVPKNIPDDSVAHRRASSLEPVFRVGSPAPRGGGRGASVDSSLQNTPVKAQRPASGLANVAEEDNSQRLVNFSRPMSPGLSMPKQSASSQSSSGWFAAPVVNEEAVQRVASPAASRPKSSSGLSAFELHQTQQSIQNAADRPVKKHHVSYAVQGTQLANGSMRAKPSGTAVQSRSFLALRQPPRTVDPNSPDAVYDPSSRTFIHKQDAMARHRELNEEPEEPEQPTQQFITQHVDNHPAHRAPRQQPTQRASTPLRQPAHHEASPASQRSKDIVYAQPDTAPKGRTSRTPEPNPNTAVERRHVDDFADEKTKLQNPTPDTRVEPLEFHAISKSTAIQDTLQPPVPAPVIPTPTNAVVGQGPGTARSGHERQSSLSPPRNAHFAPVAVELAGEKHQPPPRSSSPAKSALKSSPSVSRRGSSPVAPAGRFLDKVAPNDMSDTASDDGLKKKKNMRVSFEETPIIAGTSAYADAERPTSPSGLSASKWSPTKEKETGFEDFMKPRAALPVFGSLRDKERRSAPEDVAEKVTETVSSTPMTASVASIGEPLQSSNDHALGNIVAQDFARKHATTKDPLPPEVTTVEGSGYASDSSRESSLYKHSDELASSQLLPVPEPKSLTAPLDKESSTPGSIAERIAEVPNIALQPATPSPYERSEPTYQTTKSPTTVSDRTPPVPVVQTSHPQPVFYNENDDSSDDNSSVYSDAYEDLTDAEGGFGSIDAMVGSPIVPPSSGLMSSKYAEKSAAGSSASKLRNESNTDEDVGADATASTSKRQSYAQHEAARAMPAPTSQEEPREEHKTVAQSINRTGNASPLPQSSPKPLKSAMKKPAVAQSSEPQMRKTMRGGPNPVTRTEPSVRSSMRGGPDPTPQAQSHLRKSMRGTDPTPLGTSQPQMRKSMRGSDPTTPSSPGLAASRHSMIQLETKPARAALQKKYIPAAAPAPKSRPQSMPAAKPVATPVPTYDSDSDGSASSFQRSRASRNRNQGGRYTMRGSMRNNPAPTMRPSATAPAQKPVRAISPPVSPAPAMRKSMRPSSPTQEPAPSSKFRLRSLSPVARFRSSKSPERAPPSPTQSKKMTMPTFSKQPKQSKQKKAAVAAPRVSLKSRFADSSDEDDDELPRHFQSRFADSDSDDAEDYRLPPGLAPVRGIPRKAGEEDGDSTDLEEETDYEKARKSAKSNEKAVPETNGAGKGQQNGTANVQSPALAGGSLRDSKHAPTLPAFEAGDKAKAKRGFFGLGKKKTAVGQPDAASPPPPPPPPASEPDVPLPPAQRNRKLGLPLTPIDEDKDFGEAVVESPEPKKAPKLQRRSTPEWPLPSPLAVDSEERPMSSDGIAPRRPRFQMRQSSTTSNITAPTADTQRRTVSFGKDGKKKKFQGLRRVFGLND